MIENGLAMNDPADISRREGAQPRLAVLRLSVAEHGADVAHGPRQLLAASRIDRQQQRIDLRPRAALGGGEGRPASVRQ